ncbi:type I phosphomannose isomerase catalytic subunit [Adhaeretor mobilis]|uniref:Phosphohexomutase n=1 Tax=Adhaeretor mobilis TaxID=1930276 RepID=A0A517MZB2_9BACT|nr:type I phosphomannose isomerase catalytic subunit [Adhaeretor mobilis]QDT00194.1 Putative mannose-6-phosphate isomerase YvyI [Adhaeretor mobilis]
MASCNYPLRFLPIFRRYLWGGRRLATMLSKPIGEGEDYAESWEVVDHGEDQSIVEHGWLEGAPLSELVEHHAGELFGISYAGDQFPLLMKLLDCNRTLSVQVHPNDEQGAKLDPPDLGKTEAWVVLAADPGSKIYAGLKPGVTREQVASALEVGECEECLHAFEPTVGDCVFIPAGTVHALGAGLVIAEIQQASDTTFRLFDWNRVGADGKPRPLHIEQSLDVIDYERGPVSAQVPEKISIESSKLSRERLVDCDKFVLDRVRLSEAAELGGDDCFHLLAVLEGSVQLQGDQAGVPLSKGQTALVPSAAGSFEVTPQAEATLLDIFLP